MSEHSPGPREREGQWSEVAHQWRQLGTPLRPVPEDLELFRDAVRDWRGEGCAPRVLLLGVTPEIYHLGWPEGTDFLAIDRTPAMIEHVWPGPRDAVRCGDWTEIDLPDASRDIVLCDGGLHLLQYPGEQQRLVTILARIVSDRGLVIFRLFVPPAVREVTELVLSALAAGEIPSMNVLKLRLGMSMMESATAGVELATVWQRLHEAEPDLDTLADRLGWTRDHARAIHAYRTSRARYHFADVDEIQQMFCVQPGGFVMRRLAVPGYLLGDRCPTIVLERRPR